MAGFLLEQVSRVYVSEWHPIVRYGIRHDWRRLVPYPCELSDPSAWGNLLAFRDPIDESVLAGAIGKLAKVVEMPTGQDRNSLVPATDPIGRAAGRERGCREGTITGVAGA